jgi:tripartite-type tricarboxylate transporter receptor subunit TctC
LEQRLLFGEIMKKLIFTLCLLFGTVASAETIRLVVPFAQGGGGDQLARVIQKHISQDIGKTIVVEIRPGASTEIGTAIVANSDSKELVLLLNAPSIVINGITKDKLSYKESNLIPLVHFGHVPFVLVVSKKSGIKSFRDLENLDPNRILTYGSSGTATGTHLSMVNFSQHVKKNMLHVPYKGSGAAIPDLISGNIDALMIHWTAVNQFIETDQITAIAIESDKRLAQLPGVPTFREFGIPNVGLHGWQVLFSNATSQTQLQNQIALSLSRMISDDKKNNLYRELGYVKEKDPLNLKDFMKIEKQRYSKILKQVDLQ